MDTHLSFSRMHPITPNVVEPRIMWMKSTECTCHQHHPHPPLRIYFTQSMLLRHCHVLRETSNWKLLGERILFVVVIIIIVFPGSCLCFLWIQSSNAIGGEGGGFDEGEGGGLKSPLFFIVSYDHLQIVVTSINFQCHLHFCLHFIIANSNTSAQHIF